MNYAEAIKWFRKAADQGHSTAQFLVGAAYAAWTIATQSHVTNSSVLLILLSVVIFLVGLISEQISLLRFEGRRP